MQPGPQPPSSFPSSLSLPRRGLTRACLKRVWLLALAVFSTYLLTLAIFPGVLAENVHVSQVPTPSAGPTPCIVMLALST